MEFGVEIGEYRGDGPGPAAGAPTATAGAAEPERCVVAYYLQQRVRVHRRVQPRHRQLTDDANVEITGRNLRKREQLVSATVLGGE